jgi:hypothetical protein
MRRDWQIGDATDGTTSATLTAVNQSKEYSVEHLDGWVIAVKATCNSSDPIIYFFEGTPDDGTTFARADESTGADHQGQANGNIQVDQGLGDDGEWVNYYFDRASGCAAYRHPNHSKKFRVYFASETGDTDATIEVKMISGYTNRNR